MLEVAVFMSIDRVGFVCELQKTMAEGKDYCEDKINLVKSNFDKLIQVCFLQHLKNELLANYDDRQSSV